VSTSPSRCGENRFHVRSSQGMVQYLPSRFSRANVSRFMRAMSSGKVSFPILLPSTFYSILNQAISQRSANPEPIIHLWETINKGE